MIVDDGKRDELLTALVERPNEREQLLASADLSDAERERLVSLVQLADAVWIAAHGVPPVAEDPVAALLGLAPDPTCRLDPTALAQARKKPASQSANSRRGCRREHGA